MLESYIENRVCEWAKKNGWLHRKLKWIGRDGAPDRFFLKGGRVVLIEFKRPGGKLRPAQRREVPRLTRFGAEVYVIDNIQEGISVLSRRPNFMPGVDDII